ncbi:MAG: helix-turn-helix domain-containing protein [Vicinamibacterales bacterium]
MPDLLTTREASRVAGVGPTAIKRWADDGRLSCVKTAGGHRRFRRSELEALLRAEALAGRTGGGEWDEWFDALLDQDGQFRVEARLLQERAATGSWAQVAERVGRLLTDVGERWARGTLTITEEHLVSDRLRRAVSRVVEAMPLRPDAPSCLIATADGDPHTGGLLLTELTLREAGWRTIWAGAPIPAGELAAAITRWKPRMVALSASVAAKPSILATEVVKAGKACRAVGASLALGGRGKWPAIPVSTGERFEDFASFSAFALRVADQVR